MTNFLWARTLLTAYRYVPKVVKEVDDVIEEHALKSSSFECSGFSKLSTLTQVNKIVELIDLKDRAIFIKNYVEEIMPKLSVFKQKLLSKIFFKNEKITEVVRNGQFSPRTYYRRIQEALDDFEENMKANDYKILDFQKDFKDDWIMKIQELFLKQNSVKEDVVLKNSKIAA